MSVREGVALCGMEGRQLGRLVRNTQNAAAWFPEQGSTKLRLCFFLQVQ